MGSQERPRSEAEGAFDAEALNQALAWAQEATRRAALAREQDIAGKVIQVEKLVGTHQSAAQQLEQVRQIVKTKEFNTKKQAEAETKAKVEQLERDYAQLKVDFDSFLAEIDTEAERYRKLTTDFHDWVERFEDLKNRLNEVIKASLSPDEQSKLNFFQDEISIQALYFRAPGNLQRVEQFTKDVQEKKDKLGTFAFGLKGKLDAILNSDALKKLREFLAKEDYKLEPREVFHEEVKVLQEKKSELFSRLIQLDSNARWLGLSDKVIDGRLIDDRLGQERKRAEEVKDTTDVTAIYWKQGILHELRKL